MTKEPLTRCGACGSWQSNPDLYTQKEQDEAVLIYDGCNEGQEPYQPTVQEMAEAGIISLDSNGYPQ